MKLWSWWGSTKIGGSGWLGSMKNDKPRWLKRQTLPSRRSSLRQAQLTQSSCCPGASPLQFPFTTWMKCWQMLHDRDRTSQWLLPHPSWRAHRPQPPQTVKIIKLGLHLFQCLPCWISPLLAHPLLDVHLQDSLAAPHRKSGTTLPAAHSVINATSGPMLTPKRSRLRVNTALQRVMRTCLNWHWRPNPAQTTWAGTYQSPSSPTKATADPGNGTVVETSRSTRDQDSEGKANHSGSSSDLDTSRENMADSDIDSASRDHFTCLDTDEVTVRITWKKYRKRVQASCSLGKDGIWSEAQLKQIGNSCQVMWEHDHEIIRTEWDCTLEENCSSFKMCKMMVWTGQLLCIAEATNLKI